MKLDDSEQEIDPVILQQALGAEVRGAELVAEFRATYKNRRALREELDKAFG